MTFPRTEGPLNLCGPQVRKRRAALKWSQTRLAMECQLAGWDISRDTVAWIESRRRRVGDIELTTLASVLQVSVLDLLPS